MADLSITVGVDDSDAQAKLVKIQQAFRKFGEDSRKILDDLNTNLKNLNGSFNPLEGSISKLIAAFGLLKAVDFVKDAAEFANMIDSVAKSVGMTIPELLELQSAVTKAGGTAQAASRGIEMFYMKLDQARQGGTQQQYAFERLGISLQDLKKMDDVALFKKTIEQLAQMPASAARNRIEVELLSKSFRGIPIQEINAELDKLRGTMDDTGPVIQSGAQAFKHAAELAMEFKIAILTIAQPLMDTFKNLKISTDDIVASLRNIISVVGAIIAFNFVGTVLAWGSAFIRLVPVIYEGAKALKEFSIAEVLAANATGFGSIASLILKFIAAVAVFFGIEEVMNRMLKSNAEANHEAAEATKTKTEEDRKAATVGQQVYTAYARLNAAIREQTQAFKENIQAQIEKLKHQADDAGMSNVAKAGLAEELRVREEFRRKIEELNIKLKEARAAKPDSDQAKTVGSLSEAIKDLTASQDKYVQSAKEAAEANARAADAAHMRLFFSEEQIKIDKDISDLERDINALTHTNQEKTIDNLYKQMNVEAEAAIKRRQAQLGPDAIVPYEEQLDILNRLEKQYEPLIKKQQELNSKSRDFNVGWTQAFKQYVEDATNSANMARDVFSSVIGNMNSALDNFVMTGKLSFSSLTTSILQDLLKIQLKASLAGVLKASGLSSMFGGAFADGGNIPAGKFGLVGEAGPELVAGPATVTSAKDTAGMIGGGDTNNHYYNIQAVDAKSVAQLFAENRMTMFGMVEQARRELPMRTR
jgi:lambda family phage tail tape measure protein